MTNPAQRLLTNLRMSRTQFAVEDLLLRYVAANPGTMPDTGRPAHDVLAALAAVVSDTARHNGVVEHHGYRRMAELLNTTRDREARR